MDANATASEITSTQNPKIKRLLLLRQKSSERRREGLFVVEGKRELLHCINAGYNIRNVYYCPEITGTDNDLADIAGKVPSFRITENVYRKAAYRGGTEGVLAEAECRCLPLAALQLGSCPLIIVLESVEKPGNLGAVLRTADAAKADAVIVCDPLTDLYNPNLIRSSIGAVFTVPCVACSTDECISFLKERNIQIVTAQLQNSELYYATDMRRPTALVMGNEATGLGEEWRRNADRRVRIPMLGQLDSLNVSASTAILTYEAVRQRAGM